MECYKHNRCKNALNCPRNYETFEGFCRDFERGRYSTYVDKKDKYESSNKNAATKGKQNEKNKNRVV